MLEPQLVPTGHGIASLPCTAGGKHDCARPRALPLGPQSMRLRCLRRRPPRGSRSRNATTAPSASTPMRRVHTDCSAYAATAYRSQAVNAISSQRHLHIMHACLKSSKSKAM